MRILVGHNFYREYGGEDAAAQTEMEMLKNQGDVVELFSRSNSEIESLPAFSKLSHALNMHWSKSSYRQLRKKIREFSPDLVHFHNIYFMLTPAVYYACKDEGVAVVQSLHNFRPLCANGLFFRNNQVCEDCVGGGLEQGIKHKCFNDSKILTQLVVNMLKKHRKRRTWHTHVDRYIAATDFTRQKYVQSGFPDAKISIKPSVFELSDFSAHEDQGYILYLGRLSPEKGLDVLLNAYFLDPLLPPLKILGEGSLMASILDLIEKNKLTNVELCGFVQGQKYAEIMQGAKAVVVPSTCYENFPRAVVEAYAYGIPVIASYLGSLKEIIRDQETGLFFKAGDATDLKEKLNQLLKGDAKKMRLNARAVYEDNYAPKVNYQVLKSIYDEAIDHNAHADAFSN